MYQQLRISDILALGLLYIERIFEKFGQFQNCKKIIKKFIFI